MNDPVPHPPDLDRQESRIHKIIKKPSLVRYLIQSLFGITVLILCAIQITIHPNQANELWVGLICAIVGIFLPHPSPEKTNSSTDSGDTTTTTIHERVRSPVIRPRKIHLREH
jgi:hypothetical protein